MNVMLCKGTNIDNGYQHEPIFRSSQEQRSWFINKRVKYFELNIQPDSMQSSIVVPFELWEVEVCDYLVIESNNGLYYYIINSIEYNTKSSTRLNIECDVIQTYMFSYSIEESFIDRMHVNRWNADGTPTTWVEDEGLQTGEMVLIEKEKLYNFKKQYLVTSSSPLGVIEYTKNGIGGDDIPPTGEGSSGNWKNGEVSSKGLLFIKQEEGFAPWGCYFNGESFRTAGYGITENYQSKYYQKLLPFPTSEETASKVTYECLNNEFGKYVASKIQGRDEVLQHHFDVFVSLAFNYGIGGLGNLNTWKMYISGSKDYTAIGNAIGNLSANPNRRKREADLFKTGVYPDRKIQKYTQSGGYGSTVTENGGKGWLPDDHKKEVENQFGWGTKPTTGRCSAGYPRYPNGGEHTGVDIANNAGTPIYAWRGGTVYARSQGYGNSVRIQHDDGSIAIYGHMLDGSVSLNVGDKVQEGSKIGLMGSTGNSTGNHLHFEIRTSKTGSHVNPWYGLSYGDNV